MQASSSEPGPGHNNPPSAIDLLRERFKDQIAEVDKVADDANKARAALGEKAEVTADEQIPALVEVGIRAGKLSKALDAKRLETTKPVREEIDTINGFFNTLATRMDRVKTTFEEIAGQWDRKKREAEKRAAAEAALVAQQERDAKMAEAVSAQHSVVSDVVMNEAIVADERATKLAAQATSAGTGPTRTEDGTMSSSKPWTFAVQDWAKVDIAEFRDEFSVADIEKAIRAHVRKHKNTRPLKGVSIFQDEKTRFRG